MRRYLQLIVVLAIFFSAVLVRHLRESAGQTFPGMEPANTIGFHASPSPSPSPQPTATQAVASAAPPPTPQPTPTVATASAVNATPTTTAPAVEVTPTPTPATTKWPTLFGGSVFMDGAFTGKPSRISYGEAQVTVVMRSGRVEAVLIVEFPDRTPTSVNMSAEILPRLVAEAIAKQDWDVDIISGATQTTVAFQKAMIYALRQSEQG